LSDRPLLEKIYSGFFEHEYPADFAIIVIWLVACFAAIYLNILSETMVREVLDLPVILFIPGYCLLVALFPKEGDISLSERIIYSVGLSLVLFSLIGLGLYFTQGVFPFDTIVISLIFFSLVIINIAYVRRAFLPYDSRFRVPFTAITGSIRKRVIPAESSRIDYLINMTLAIIILAAIITTMYVIATPKEGERFSEFYILGENRTAANYPDQIMAGQNYPMYVGVGNREFRNTVYTIETWLVQTEFDNVTNTSHIVTMDPNDHLSVTLAQNETTIIPYNLSVNKTGYDRVEFLLFNDRVPGLDVTGSDRINASYRDLHLWVSVGEAEYEDQSGEETSENTTVTS
jgi:uncharacterized membrane protein